MVEELAGHWETARSLTPAVEATATENLTTPCNLDARSLLVCALAHAQAGDDVEAQRLERSADDLGMEGYGLTIETPRLRLLLLRHDLEGAERLLECGEALYFARTAAAAARFDALTALGYRQLIEEEAEAFLRPNTYLEPFALRALGRMRQDNDLVVKALERFEAMGLEWHATETRALISAGH
jgi:hypothetical protein